MPDLGPWTLPGRLALRETAPMSTVTHPYRARRPRGERGQSSAEYLGAIVVVVVVVAAVLVGATGVGKHVSAGIQAAVCRISGGGCTVNAILHVPDEDCEVYSHAGEVSTDVVAFSVDLGASGSLTLSKAVSPDGKEHWYVDQAGELRAGADFLLGEEAGLGDLGEGVGAEVTALATAGGGAKMEFADEAAAREFMTAAAHEPVKQGLTGWDPTGLTHWLADKVDGHHYAPPAPEEYFFEAGAQAADALDAKAGVASAGASAGVAGVVGVKVTPVGTGGSKKTVYLKLSADAAMEMGLFDAAGASTSGSGEVVVGIEYDPAGHPVAASLEGAGTLKGELSGSVPMGPETTLAQIAGFTPKGAPESGQSASIGGTAKIGLSIDLTQGQNSAVLARGLHALGVPVLRGLGGPTPDAVTGLKGVYDLFDSGADGTSLTVTTYDTKEGGSTVGAKAGDVLTFGIEAGYQTTDDTLTSGYYYSPGDGLVKWQSCGA